MENFWNSSHPSCFSSDICAFLNARFSDVAFYPEKLSRHATAVGVFQKDDREVERFLDGKVRESYYFTLISPFAGEDQKALDSAMWLLDKCLCFCENASEISFGNSDVTFLYFERTKNPSKSFRTNMGDDFYSAEIKLVVERQG